MRTTVIKGLAATLLALTIGGAAASPLRAQDGTIKVRIDWAKAFKKDTDDITNPPQDFYAINSIDNQPPLFTPEIGGRDHAVWSGQVNSKLVPGRNQRFFDLYFELWDKDNCCFGNVDDGFDISPQSGPPGPLAPGGVYVPQIPTGSNPHVTYDVCTGRLQVVGVNGSNPIAIGSDAATLDGANTAPGLAHNWGSLHFEVERIPANWLPDDVAIGPVRIVQSVYGATHAIVDKPTSLVVDITSTHPFPIAAPVSGQMSDGITTVQDTRIVNLAPGTVANPSLTRVALFDGSTAPPYRPQKSFLNGFGKVTGSASVNYAENTSPNAPIQLMDCGNINNVGQATDLPLVRTFDGATVFERFDYREDRSFMTAPQLQAMYDREEPYRLASWPLASLNSSKTFDTTDFDHGSDCLMMLACFEPFNTLLHYSSAAAQAGIDRWVLAVRNGWFADNHFRHQFVSDTSIGYSLGWFAPRAVLAEDGYYGVSTHELGHSYNLSQHPCSNPDQPWGPGCSDEYAHPANDGRAYQALGYDVVGQIYPHGIHVAPSATWGGLACPATPPQGRDICAANFMDITPDGGFANWIDTFTYEYLMTTAIPHVDPPVINLTGALRFPDGLGTGTAPPAIEGAFTLSGYQFMGIQDMDEAPPSGLGEVFSGVGAFRIRFVTPSGVRDYRFDPRFLDDPSRPDLIGGFSMNLPWDPATVRIQLIGPADYLNACRSQLCEGDGVLLDDRPVTPAPPSASDLRAGRDASAPPTPAGGVPATPTIGPGHEAVIDWTAFDPDSPTLRATLMVIAPGSAAGGSGAQVPVAIDIAAGTFRLPHAAVADAPGLYAGRVLVSDGVNTTEVWNGGLFNVCNLSNGGVEICNGVDDDCNGTVDDAPRPGSEQVSLNPQPFPPAPGGDAGALLQWTADPLALSYDAVFGDVERLRASGGDFAVAVLGCLADDMTGTSLGGLPTPPVGEAYWFELRGNNCSGPGTYDSDGAAQSGSRDAAIDASPLACRP